MPRLIKNGVVVNADGQKQLDLLIEGSRISAVGDQIKPEPGMEVIDAHGAFVLPGGVDAHVHLDLPMFGTVSSDDHYSGTKAAAFGGTTTVIDFISQDCDDLAQNVKLLREKADAKVAIDYALHANISHLTPDVEQQIPTLVDLGITSIKVFTAYNGRLRLQDGEIFKVMRIARDNGMLTMLHAENGDVIDILVNEALAAHHTSPEWHAKTRPAWGAVESVTRASAFAAIANAPLYVVHMNAAGEVDQLEYARQHGLQVFGETCPQYLFFSAEDLARPDGAKWICSPPLRSVADQEALWKGLERGIIQTIATDHCPFFFDGRKAIDYEGKSVTIPGKELGIGDFTRIPNGLPGVGDRLPVLWTKMVSSGRFSPSQFVQLNCSNPAKLFGLYPQKGVLQPGSDADLVIWDADKMVDYGLAWSHQRTDYNLYEGWKLRGFPIMVFSRGECIVEGDEWKGRPGHGEFLHCAPFRGFSAG